MASKPDLSLIKGGKKGPPGTLTFSSSTSGASRIKALLIAAEGATALALSKDRLEKLLLRRIRERLLPRGTTPRSQKDNAGKDFAPNKPATIKRRTNKRTDQALYDTGELYRSITVVRSNLRASALATPSGAGFSIGIAPGSEANKYARTVNFGGYTPKGGARIPARRFMGVGKADASAVDAMIQRTFRSAGW